MRRLAIGIVVLFWTPLLAAGWVGYQGRNALGETVTWDFEDWQGRSAEDNGFHMFVLATVEVSSPGKARAVFNKQPCEVNVNTKMLACDSSGTSPLAGTRYVGQLVKRKNADPITRYRCVKGCENNSRAPTTMVQDDQSD